MSCEDIKVLLDEYITGELAESDKAMVEEHLSTCSECRREYNELKALKNQLKELEEKLPEGFEERLTRKIKKEKRSAYFYVSRFGVSVAAAVVLICAISLGYGMGHNKELDNRLKSMGSGAENTAEAVQEQAEADSAEAEQNTLSEETDAITEITDAANIADVNTQDREITTEQVTEAVIPKTEKQTVTEVQPRTENTAADSVGTDFAQTNAVIPQTAEQAIPEAEQPKTAEKAVAEAEQADLGSEADEAVPKNNSVMMKSGLSVQDSAVADFSADGSPEPAAAALKEEVTLLIDGQELDRLKNKLETLARVKNLRDCDGGVAADVENMSYEALKAALKDFDLTEESADIDEDCNFYSLIIKAK